MTDILLHPEPIDCTDPLTLEDMLLGYDRDTINALLRDWLDDPPAGKELI